MERMDSLHSHKKRMGPRDSFKVFSQWTNKKLSKTLNEKISTAKLIFLSKTGSEIAKSHKDYRCIAVQPTFVRIMEDIVIKRIDKRRIELTQFEN